jgi:hypothetical protein
MTKAEEALIRDVLEGEQPPDHEAWRAGQSAHKAGKEFHECPYPLASYLALCWRIGWNDRALALAHATVAL